MPFTDNPRRAAKKEYTLLTGATGLVGRYLLRDLLLKGKRLTLVVRPGKSLCERERIESILQMWEAELGKCLPRPVIFSGNLCEENLGLSNSDFLWIKANCKQVIHNAAILKFQAISPEHEPFLTNKLGTQNVLDFALRAEISDLHYVSTAYVSGCRDEVIMEDDFDHGQEFRNDYERSKFAAESLVRSATGFATKTIYRPAVIIGDSRTGYTSTYHGLFLYLRLMDLLMPHQQRDENGVIQTPLRLPMDGTEPRNLVAVDWVASVISHIVCTPEAHGRTFHLSPDRCSTAEELIGYCYKYFNSGGVEFCGADAERDADSEFAEAFFDNVRVYESYETSDPTFDKQNVKQWAGHLKCPELDEAMVRRFIDYGRANQWGKVRPAKPSVDHWFEDELDRIGDLAETILTRLPIATDTTVTIGLDVLGPGGGQWTLEGMTSTGFRILPGLPGSNAPILTIEGHQVAQLLDGLSSQDPHHAQLGIFAQQIESTLSL